MAEAVAPWVSRPLSGALRLLSDERLVNLAKRGDRGALSAICRRYQQPLYRYCEGILHHSEEAKDALQNTLVSAVAALPGEEREIHLRPWLYRIAHNESIAILRRRRPEAPIVLEETIDSGDAGRGLAAREDLRELVADLRSLGERQRGALVMRELSGLSFEEIGNAFGTSEAAARQAVYEARVGLQEIREGREMKCEDARRAISANDGRILRGRKLRAHLRDCAGCRDFRAAISTRRRDFALLAPPLPALAAAGILQSVLGSGGAGTGISAGTASVAAGAAGKSAAGALALKSAVAIATVAAVGAGAAQLTGLAHPLGGGSDSSSGPAQRAPASAPAEHHAVPGTHGPSQAAGTSGQAGGGRASHHAGHHGAGDGGPSGGASSSAPGQAPAGTLPPQSNGHGVASHGTPSSTPASPNASSNAPSHTPGPPASAGNSGNTPGPPASPPGNSSGAPGHTESAPSPSGTGSSGASGGNSASTPSATGSTPSANETAPGKVNSPNAPNKP
jgi:RNA polymerase sigma factor (sigma-70 family)